MFLVGGERSLTSLTRPPRASPVHRIQRDGDSPGADSAFRRSEDNLLRERENSPMVITNYGIIMVIYLLILEEQQH